ncbi:MAG TPA: hypothetical protein VGC46_06175 [Allosphingosinicella sp.]
MAKEPSYPKDAAVGSPSAEGGETLNVARGAKEATKADEKGSNFTRNFVAGAAVGVGSAALVAALLYANRSRRSDKGGS